MINILDFANCIWFLLHVVGFFFNNSLKISNPSLVHSANTDWGLEGTGVAVWHDWSWMRFGGRKAEAGTGQLGLPMTSQRTVPVLSKFPALFLQNAGQWPFHCWFWYFDLLCVFWPYTHICLQNLWGGRKAKTVCWAWTDALFLWACPRLGLWGAAFLLCPRGIVRHRGVKLAIVFLSKKEIGCGW